MASSTEQQPPWLRWRDRRILDLRLCDLGVSLKGTWMVPLIDRLYGELRSVGIRLRPHVWLSNEWFSPDGIPGIGIPFYLAHPRLIRLERRYSPEVEGATRRDFMRLIRHETGHAVQHGYRLHLRRKTQRLFGKSSTPYPDYYRPNPASTRFVINLDLWYGQSHPDEDFAETFAVWLSPRSHWRRRYAGWPALKKLEYIDELMQEIRGRRPAVTTRERVDPLPSLKMSLRDHHTEKRQRYGFLETAEHDAHLRRIFGGKTTAEGSPAASFLRKHRRRIEQQVLEWAPDVEYALDVVFDEIVGRCKTLGLRAVGPPGPLIHRFTVLITARTMRYMYRSREWHPV